MGQHEGILCYFRHNLVGGNQAFCVSGDLIECNQKNIVIFERNENVD